jgi:threonine dehydrogenase-like Zn-dependent dehydrogenase
VVVLGQGLVGNLVMQAHRIRVVARVITVDTLQIRVLLSA